MPVFAYLLGRTGETLGVFLIGIISLLGFWSNSAAVAAHRWTHQAITYVIFLSSSDLLWELAIVIAQT